MGVQRVLDGAEPERALCAELRSRGVERLIVIGDGRSFEACGAAAGLRCLQDEFLSSMYFAGPALVGPDDVVSCLAAVDAHRPDAIVAVGGGVIMDLAKLARHCYASGLQPDGLPETTLHEPSAQPFLAAVPTTCGSGSEATHFAVMFRSGTKHSIALPAMRPDFVLLNPRYLMSLPQGVAAASGLDALAQAIESFWSVHSCEESAAFSLESVRLLRADLVDSVLAPTLRNRAAMQRAANLSGRAINLAKTTACHAISYQMTAAFGVPHGAAVFLTLPAMFRFNMDVTEDDCLDARGPEFVRGRIAQLANELGSAATGEAPGLLAQYPEKLGLPMRLREYGIGAGDIALLAGGFDLERARNNPRRVARDCVREILGEIA